MSEVASRREDQEFYSASVHYFDDDAYIAEHVAIVQSYVDAVAGPLSELAGRPNVRVLELGAGLCLASLLVRQRIPHARLTCLDISMHRMRSLAEPMANRLGTSTEGLEFLEGDFTFDLPFAAGEFDLVLFDAALHHSRDIWKTLGECHRVLASTGAVAALREQYLPPLTFRYALDRLLRSPEVKAGVAENSYLKEQYEYYFRANHFEPRFIPVTPGWKWRLLAPLNGVAFSKWSVWATKAPARNGGSAPDPTS